MVSKIQKMSPIIWEEIRKAKHILLCCHPSPDGDCVGAVLAMKFVLEKMGKKVTAISGDSEIPLPLSFLPGSDKIVKKNFLEMDLKNYDLFVILDISSLDQITKRGPVVFPENLSTIVIDHHLSNDGFGKIDLIDATRPATCQILYELFAEGNIKVGRDTAVCLLTGIYYDTGGFQYPGTSTETFLAAAKLAAIAPDFTETISQTENNNDPKKIEFMGLLLGNLKKYFNNKVVVGEISFEKLRKYNIGGQNAGGSELANILKSAIGHEIGITFVEKEKDSIAISLRTRDAKKYDLSKLALALGGGGHRGAAGAVLKMPFAQAKKFLLQKISEVYPKLGKP